LKQTAKLNLPSAHHFLGHSYFKGTGVEKDYQMALIHFQAAADRGYSTSQLIVAHFYAYGLTGPAKIDIALRYANLALEQEREKAVEKIAEYENLLSKSQPIPPVKPVDSVDLDIPSPDSSSLLPPPLPPSPQQGLNPPEDSLSENNRLPPIYQTAPLDNSIKSDNEITKQESASTVESALVSEKLELAKKHYFGREMKLDLNLAFKLFSELSMMGNAEAARYLGIMYLRGKGVDKNQNEALNWFEKAAAGGDELAKRNLKTLKMLVNKN
jgi:TPR repeat protein